MTRIPEPATAGHAVVHTIGGELQLLTEQPAPVPNESISVQAMVRDDLVTREEIGVQRYGTALQPHNGRDMLRDAYEKALDLACYLRGAIAERPREDVDAAVAEVQARYDADRRRWDALEAEFRRQLDGAVEYRDRYLAELRQIRPAAHLAKQWRDDPAAFPGGAAAVLEQIITEALGGRS